MLRLRNFLNRQRQQGVCAGATYHQAQLALLLTSISICLVYGEDDQAMGARGGFVHVGGAHSSGGHAFLHDAHAVVLTAHRYRLHTRDPDALDIVKELQIVLGRVQKVSAFLVVNFNDACRQLQQKESGENQKISCTQQSYKCMKVVELPL